jgi:hypothetical protein
VYTAEHGRQLLCVKLFRYSSSIDQNTPPQHGAVAGVAGGGGGSSSLSGPSSSGSNVVRETELETVLSLQYRLCSLQHDNVLQHIAVYPRVYEVRHAPVTAASDCCQ